MTEPEVMNILGRPRLDATRRYRPHTVAGWQNAPKVDDMEKGWRFNWWGEGEWVVQVFFDKNGKAFQAYFISASDSQLTFEQMVERYRKMIGL